MSERPRRVTRQQQAITAALQGRDAFRSAQELHAQLRSGGATIGLATVYRTLQALADKGLIDMLRTEGGESLYRACSRGHHHHLVCRTCGRTVEVEADDAERWAIRTATAYGFTDVEHTLEIFGRCASCSGSGG
ncbi:MAG: transcriptional repressor [Actinobacteria bacterium]|nr:transcriptional repressor [Actinomycetota bacterium]